MEILTLPTRRKGVLGPDIFRLWFSPSGRRLLMLTGHGGGANRLLNWDLAAGKLLGRRKVVTDSEHDNCFPWPAFDPAMRYRLFDGHVTDRKSGRRVKLEYAEYELAISPDGRTAYTLGADGRLVDRFDLSWEVKGRTRTVRRDKDWSRRRPDGVYSSNLLVSPAGDLLVVWTGDGEQLLPFRLPGGEPLPAVPLPVFATDGVQMMMEPYGRQLFSPDGQLVAVAGDGVTLADPLGGRPVRVLDERHFADLAFTPDGGRLVGVRKDEAVVWDVADGGATAFHLTAAPAVLRSVAVAPDGLTAAAGDDRGRRCAARTASWSTAAGWCGGICERRRKPTHDHGWALAR